MSTMINNSLASLKTGTIVNWNGMNCDSDLLSRAKSLAEFNFAGNLSRGIRTSSQLFGGRVSELVQDTVMQTSGKPEGVLDFARAMRRLSNRWIDNTSVRIGQFWIDCYAKGTDICVSVRGDSEIYSASVSSVSDLMMHGGLVLELEELGLKDSIMRILHRGQLIGREFGAGEIYDLKTVDELINDLRLGGSHAAFALGEIGDPRAVDALIKELEDFDNTSAAQALGEIGGPKAVSALIRVLSSGDKRPEWVHYYVARALGRTGDSRAVDTLVKALKIKEDVWRVRLSIFVALGQIGDTRAIDVLIKFLNESSFDIYAVLGLRETSNQSGVDALVKVLKNKGGGRYARLLNIFGDSEARDDLIRALGDKAQSIGLSASKKLVGDSRTVDELVKALEDKDWNVRESATEALGKIGGPKAVNALAARALEDEEFIVRSSAAKALGKIGSSKAVNALVAKAFGDENFSVRSSAAVALGYIGDPIVMPILKNALTDPIRKNQYVSALAFVKMGWVIQIYKDLERMRMTVQGKCPEYKDLEIVPMSVQEKCPHCNKLNEGNKSRCEGTIKLTDGREINCQFPLMLVSGRYKLVKEIGRGGMAIVYLAQDTHFKSHTERVIKVLLEPTEIEQDSEQHQVFVERFNREVEALHRLSEADDERRRHVVAIKENYGFEKNLGHYFVMEHLKGMNLEESLNGRKGNFNIDRVLNIFFHICDGLDFVHTNGVAHRDLKPSNVFLVGDDENPNVKLIDFGIVKILDNKLTQITRQFVGTPIYVLPDKNAEPSELDTYSLAIMFYEMLTSGGHPLEIETARGNSMTLVALHLIGNRISMLQRAPNHPDRSLLELLDPIILKAVSKDGKERYKTVGEFRKAIEDAVSIWKAQQNMVLNDNSKDKRPTLVFDGFSSNLDKK